MKLSTTTTAIAVLGRAVALPRPHSPDFSWADTKYLIAFGDSYTYVQGTHGHQNYSFIGDASNLAFSPHDLLSNRIVQNQTSTAEGGPNYLEYLTTCGLTPGLTDPQTCPIQLWDFAFAGADISTTYTPLHHPFTVSLVNQTEQFLTYADPVLTPLIDKDKTLVVIWIGINDIGDSAHYAVDFPTFYANLTTTLFASLDPVAEAGYKTYLIMLLPPLNRSPPNLVRAAGGPLPNATMINWYNNALTTRALAFQSKHPGSNALVFDTTTFLNYVLDHAAEYGIQNTTGYCPGYDQPDIGTDPGKYGCEALEKYFWFNTGHLTSHTHEILAGEVGRFLVGQSSSWGRGGGGGGGGGWWWGW
ncbi:hypothetical protein LTR78_003938 [Recurvomyces mirabilis]|uniref:Lysophospholipase A n=1 Tax=Recurvomyces mirabilis TaxID=574656 RepID=A0AAE0WR91_9PEZI|nr:hypothetical protein LTR78_003938 [Recurvomyces mirabilis]KAK5153924.1 hypothetical protein LTS14_007144 [Recurvomyces mirabilis]